MSEVWALPGPMYSTASMRKTTENMTYIMTARKTTNVVTAKETMALVLEILSNGRKKKILPN